MRTLVQTRGMTQSERWMKHGRVEEVACSCLEDDPWSCSVRGRLAKCNDLQWCNQSARVSVSPSPSRWRADDANVSPDRNVTTRCVLNLRLKGIFCVFSDDASLVMRAQCGLIGIVLTRIWPVFVAIAPVAFRAIARSLSGYAAE